MMNTTKHIALIASAAILAASCGGNKDNTQQAAQAKLPNVKVTTASVQQVSVDETYAVTLQAYAVNNIAPQATGRIIRINAEVGDYVKKGQVLAEMDSTNLVQARLQMHNAKSEYERGKALYEKGGVSKSDFESIEMSYLVSKSAYENLCENTVLESPLEGVISARNYDEGDMYTMSSPLYVVQQINTLKALAAVSESDYSLLKKGAEVEITANALPGQTFKGKVARVYPTIDSATHTVTAEIHIPNSSLTLRPGMYSNAKIIFNSTSRILLPDSAIVKQQGSGVRYVYILGSGNTVSTRNVTLGRHLGDQYEILDGLNEGETVVTSGQGALSNGSKVNIIK